MYVMSARSVALALHGRLAGWQPTTAATVTLAIGAGELRPDTPVRQVVMLITPLWYFGSLLTQHSGLDKLLDHYKAVSDTIAAAYGTH